MKDVGWLGMIHVPSIRTLVNIPSFYDWSSGAFFGRLLRQTLHSASRSHSSFGPGEVLRPCSHPSQLLESLERSVWSVDIFLSVGEGSIGSITLEIG